MSAGRVRRRPRPPKEAQCAATAPSTCRARRVCGWVPAGHPARSTAGRSSRFASRGWWRTAGGLGGRCAGASGRCSARGAPTSWSSTISAPGSGSRRRPERARSRIPRAVRVGADSVIGGQLSVAGTRRHGNICSIMDVPYAELHCHSAYSFLDGVSLPAELAQRAGELGYTALALTDHNSVSGSMELAQATRDCGVRALHGAELDIAGGRHPPLLVRDACGWRTLCRILTVAHAHTRAGPSRERGEPVVDLETVLGHSEGLVCL